MLDERFYIIKIEGTDPKNFVDFWSERYEETKKYPDNKYTEALRIGNRLCKEDIECLLQWKLGHKLWKNQKFDQGAIRNLEKLNEFRQRENVTKEDACEFLDNVCSDIVSSGIVIKIFILHIVRPTQFPIFDQHAYRSFKYITSGEVSNINNLDESHRDIYFKEYVPFVDGLMRKSKSGFRKVDRALFTFGQFLVNSYSKNIFD